MLPFLPQPELEQWVKQQSATSQDSARLAREFWERCVLAAIPCPDLDAEMAADFHVAEWRKRFDPPKEERCK